jgi:hypothetical protein
MHPDKTWLCYTVTPSIEDRGAKFVCSHPSIN